MQARKRQSDWWFERH